MALQDSSGEIWSILKFINNLIGNIIWPITLLIIFWVFRKHFAGIIGKLTGIEASGTGISLKFDQQIDETIENYLPSQTNGSTISKSAVQIGENSTKTANSSNPFHQIMNIREALNHRIILKAQEQNISTKNKSSIQLKDTLVNSGAISSETGGFFKALVDLTNSSDRAITQAQVNKVQLLYNNLKL
ncbi:hypothetical protein [Lutibacter sp.]|uniref:hypothetical protein n=1 Tax=Lutibacter sp. TaxID=1925666 RepID=UPI0025BBA97D|nr:hypothetical protein [Lutibacter sp.]MCF6167093.1 hypothetical protein [Lutibacter sp.]